MKQNDRVVHYDLLRILACFSVVMLHSAAHFWYDRPVTDATWIVLNSYDAVSRYGVPIFVMLSGALFLKPGKQTDIKKLFTHNILRLLVVYLFWSCFYAGVTMFEFGVNGGIKEIIRRCLVAKYHLWFLPMLIGIYLLVPLLQVLVNGAKKRDLEYFLGLFLVLQILGETVKAIFWRTDELVYLKDTFRVELVCGYVGYFLLGYYLHNFEVPSKWRKWIYGAGVVGAFCNILFSNLISQDAGTSKTDIYDSFSVFTFAIAIALFVWFQNVTSKKRYSEKSGKVIREMSACTLGIYMMHICFMEHTNRLISVESPLMALLVVPVYALCAMVLCGMITWILRRIPIVGRYIV